MDHNSANRDTIRMQLLRWLDRSDAYRALQRRQRQQIAAHAEAAAVFLSGDAWWLLPQQDEPAEVAQSVGRIRDAVGRRLGLLGDEDSRVTATPVSAELMRQLDYADFVAELIQELFSPVVDASERQLMSYADLLSSVATEVAVLDGSEPSELRADRLRAHRRAVAAILLGGWTGGE
jgi:predicted P-loop ATPase